MFTILAVVNPLHLSTLGIACVPQRTNFFRYLFLNHGMKLVRDFCQSSYICLSVFRLLSLKPKALHSSLDCEPGYSAVARALPGSSCQRVLE